MSQGRQLDADVITAIQLLAIQGHKSTDIQRAMEIDDRFEGRLPDDIRTIQRYARQVRANANESPPWNRTKMDGEDAALVLEVLVVVTEKTKGRIRGFNDDEARWILWVRKAATDMELWQVWIVAMLYVTGERNGRKDFSYLDFYMGVRPWRGKDALEKYSAAWKSGLTTTQISTPLLLLDMD